MRKGKSGKEKQGQFSGTEVGTLLESIHKDVKIIAEGHTDLDKHMEKLEVAVHGNSRRLDMVDLRLSVMDGKVNRLEDAVSKVSKDLKETRQELNGKIETVHKELVITRQELNEKIDRVDERLAVVESNR